MTARGQRAPTEGQGLKRETRIGSRAVVLKWGKFGSLGDIWQCLETILVVTTWGIATTSEEKAKDAVYHPTLYREAP